MLFPRSKLFAAAALLALSCAPAAVARQKPNRATAAAARAAEGRSLLYQGDHAGAAEALRAAVKLHDNFPDAWYYLGLALRAGGDFDGARKALKKSLSLYPASFTARVALAYTSLIAGKLSDAEAEGRAALGASVRAEPQYVFGILHLLNDQPEKALAEAETILKGNGAAAHAHLLKAQALISLLPETSALLGREAKAERYGEAARALEGFLNLMPAGDRTRLFWRDQLDALRAHAEAFVNPPAPGAPLAREDVTAKAVILRKPEPLYSESARGRDQWHRQAEHGVGPRRHGQTHPRVEGADARTDGAGRRSGARDRLQAGPERRAARLADCVNRLHLQHLQRPGETRGKSLTRELAGAPR